ncbi:cytochrome C oxidase subunit I, partial [Candidatus Bathyarchaeota archaeon]
MDRDMVKTWIKRWLYTTDHKDVGILYFVTSFYFAFLAALLALFMRTQLAVPNNKFLGAAEYNQAVTMHGLLMVFWFLSPLGIAFANYFIPPQIGAKDLAFPRLNALSYWLYAFGGLVTFIGFFSPGGAANAGWTNYSPLTSIQFSPNAGETLAAAGLIIVSASVTVGTINILTTILFHRAPGMTFMKMPMFTWFIFFTMLQMLWSFPSLLAGLIMLESDRLLGTMFFTSVAGGSILWDNVFWFFGHPEVYVVLLPAIGAVMEIFQVFSNRALYAKKVAVGAGFAIVAISFMIYGHHMFLTGINVTEQEVFTINTETVS